MKDLASRLIPLPRQIDRRDGQFEWGRSVTIVLEPGNADDPFAAASFAEACGKRKLARPRQIESAHELDSLPRPLILAGDPCRHLPLLQALQAAGLDITPELADEGYLLHVDTDRILLAANTPAGVFYGFQTLIQLLPRPGETAIPRVSIRDWPSLRQRGISMDFGRGEVSTPEAVEDEIRRLAHYKMNTLVLYLEDAFEFPSHPDIGERRDRLTHAQARRLDAFARRHHIALVPCVDSPGHLEHLLSHPNYAHLVEGTDTPGQRMVINVTHPETYPLLRDLYGDLCDAFTSPFIHIGGDEAVALGTGAAKPAAEKFGAARLFSKHLKELRAFLAERGRLLICWADPFEPGFFAPFGLTNYGLEGLATIPRDVLISSWHYGPMPDFDFGEKAIAMGFDLQVMTSMNSHELFPMLESAAVNVETFVPHAHRLRALGAVHTNWGDVNSFRNYTWPGNAHFAEWAWRPDGRPWADLLPLAAETLFGPGTGDVAAAYRCLGDAPAHFGWAVIGLGTPIHNCFFDPVEPRPLDEEKLGLLSKYRARLREARTAFERARPRAVHEADLLEYVAHALDQFDALADLVECRHRLAVDAASARPLLDRLSAALPELLRGYEELWHRGRMPKGIEPNVAKFRALIESVRRAAERLA